jgi:HD-like signal output (HDOD) protein
MADNIESRFLEELYTSLQNNKLILPTLPEMALRIRDVVADENSSLADISKLINKEPALAARLVQLANSPAFRTRSALNSVDMAVMRMGANMVKNLVTAMVMEQLFQSTTDVTDRKLRTYWHHAQQVSDIAIELAQNFNHFQSDQVMLAGLIHDIGVLPILTLAEDYPQLLEDEAKLDRLIGEAHITIGTAILKHWHFSEELIGVCREHENLQYQGTDKPDYVDLIIVANLRSEHKKADLTKLDWAAIPAFHKLGLLEETELEVAKA